MSHKEKNHTDSAWNTNRKATRIESDVVDRIPKISSSWSLRRGGRSSAERPPRVWCCTCTTRSCGTAVADAAVCVPRATPVRRDRWVRRVWTRRRESTRRSTCACRPSTSPPRESGSSERCPPCCRRTGTEIPVPRVFQRQTEIRMQICNAIYYYYYY